MIKHFFLHPFLPPALKRQCPEGYLNRMCHFLARKQKVLIGWIQESHRQSLFPESKRSLKSQPKYNLFIICNLSFCFTHTLHFKTVLNFKHWRNAYHFSLQCFLYKNLKVNENIDGKDPILRRGWILRVNTFITFISKQDPTKYSEW